MNKKTVTVNELIGDNISQALVENDIIVPDFKPDIAKIVQTDAFVSITNKEAGQDKVTINGKVNFTILYMADTESGENEPSNSIKSMNASVSFVHQTEITGCRDNMITHVDGDVEHIDYKIINGRKLNIKSVISLGCRVHNLNSIEMLTDDTAAADLSEGIFSAGNISDKQVPATVLPANIEFLNKKITVCNVVHNDGEEIIAREVLEVPAGKPSINELLRLGVKFNSYESKLFENKIVLKGELEICTLYLDDSPEAQIQFMEHEILFSETLALDGIRDDMDYDIDYSIQDYYYKLSEDSDGEQRILEVEATIAVSVNVSEMIEVDAVSDVYSTTSHLNINKKFHNLNQITDNTISQATIKETLELPSNTPRIEQIYNVVAKPSVTETSVEKNKAIISGIINTNLLYFSNSPDYPVCNYSHEVPFKHIVDIKGITHDMSCEAKLNIDHLSYTINKENEIDLRYILNMNVKTLRCQCVEFIEHYEVDQQAANTKSNDRPSIVLYFVQKDDNLWDIGKKYQTPLKKIMKVNNLENESSIHNVRQLLIPS